MGKTPLFLFAAVLLFGCSKSDPDVQKSRTDLIVNKKWVMTGFSGRVGSGPIIDQYASVPSYEKDDYLVYKPDLTFTANEGATKQFPTDPDIIDVGRWRLTNGDTYLEMVSTATLPPGQSITYFPVKITELTESTMKWEAMDGGNTIYVTLTAR